MSNLSVGDYFAAKMAALKAKSQVCAVAPKEKSIVVKIEVEDEKVFVSCYLEGYFFLENFSC